MCWVGHCNGCVKFEFHDDLLKFYVFGMQWFILLLVLQYKLN